MMLFFLCKIFKKELIIWRKEIALFKFILLIKHGFDVGKVTKAEEWIHWDIKFWEKSMKDN